MAKRLSYDETALSSLIASKRVAVERELISIGVAGPIVAIATKPHLLVEADDDRFFDSWCAACGRIDGGLHKPGCGFAAMTGQRYVERPWAP